MYVGYVSILLMYLLPAIYKYLSLLFISDCDPTSYIQTAHTSPLGGYPRGKRSLALCARNCQKSVSAPVGKRCHGFSHDRVSSECNLFYEFDYDLNGIGISESSDHYRRMYSCCKYIFCIHLTFV